ncbi:hypothetical protein J4E90_008983 [Alternaria incomplexa]|uniref:uncharacterized protein n=1 Tax=Alternaria incomplexa TaxID=1187928 RepID=UPI00221F7C10|nr:uncharacterized protein J4E90_008983 [Alternaria incomplexa]KAI4908358.1 hypothetical protein J4E90_008983 [Alternaria incomplexa]
MPNAKNMPNGGTLEQRLSHYLRAKQNRTQVLLADDQRIRDRINEIQAEKMLLEDECMLLEDELKSNLRQRLEDPEGEPLLQELMAVEQSKCRPVCEAMQLKLPREIRDMIYEQIVGPPAWHNGQHTVPVVASKDLGVSDPFELVSNSIGLLASGGYDHFGKATRQELAEYWYTRSTFDFGTDLHLIKAFFNGVAVDTSCKALEIVRQLEITIDCNDEFEPETERLLTSALADLTLRIQPARLRIYLRDIQGVVRYNDDRLLILLHNVRQLLPDLPGWTIEFVVHMVTNDCRLSRGWQGYAFEDIIPGHHVNLMIPGNTAMSHDEWSDKFRQVSDDLTVASLCKLTLETQLRKELEQYYDDTLHEADDEDEEEDEESEEDGTDDERDEYMPLDRDELLEIEKELGGCQEDTIIWRALGAR